MTTLKGKVALVTGAAGGVGRAIALELACRGAAVAVHHRASQTKAQELVERISTMGVPCMSVQGDVSVAAEARAIVQQVVNKWRRLDILVNNAGVTRDKSSKTADDEWGDVIKVKLNGAFYCTSAAVPFMIEQHFGRIVNISCAISQPGNLGQANYAASRGGIVAFTKTLALEMARHNITANTVTPGFMLTDMMEHVPTSIQEQIRDKIPMARFGEPEDVARTVAFLAGEADYITGQQINVNGGMSM